jgi:hypothetical protein
MLKWRWRCLKIEIKKFLSSSREVLTARRQPSCNFGYLLIEVEKGVFRRNIRSNACVSDILMLQEKYPNIRAKDWNACRDAWECGVEWALRTPDAVLSPKILEKSYDAIK